MGSMATSDGVHTKCLCVQEQDAKDQRKTQTQALCVNGPLCPVYMYCRCHCYRAGQKRVQHIPMVLFTYDVKEDQRCRSNYGHVDGACKQYESLLTQLGYHHHNIDFLTGTVMRKMGCIRVYNVINIWGHSGLIPMTVYRSGTVNSKSFVGKVLLRIKWKFELN